jgi:hypothetical protein
VNDELAEEARTSFEDVSYPAMAMLAAGYEDYAEEMIERAASDERFLVHVGNVVHVACSPRLEANLRERWGEQWVERYRRAFAT